MVAPAAGDVVVVRFPFSDLSNTKLRPAVVLANAGRGDCKLSQATSNPYGGTSAIEVRNASFSIAGLPVTSYARPGKLFTASQGLMGFRAGTLRAEPFRQVIDWVVGILRGTGSP
jgi:mRNA interferase MazF